MNNFNGSPQTRCRNMSCRPNESQRMEIILCSMELEEIQKNIIRERYIRILSNFKHRSSRYSFLYHIGHFIITVGSLIVPALMSIQYTDSGMNSDEGHTDFQDNIYWITWVVSLLVTMSNGIINLFKIDKKYYFIHTITEKLRSEGWQFMSLTGRYAVQNTTHRNQFIYFCHQVEKIKMRQIEEEYYRQEQDKKDSHNSPVSNTQKQEDINNLYPPSPNKPIYQTISGNVTSDVANIVKSIVESNKSQIQEIIASENMVASADDNEKSVNVVVE